MSDTIFPTPLPTETRNTSEVTLKQLMSEEAPEKIWLTPQFAEAASIIGGGVYHANLSESERKDCIEYVRAAPPQEKELERLAILDEISIFIKEKEQEIERLRDEVARADDRIIERAAEIFNDVERDRQCLLKENVINAAEAWFKSITKGGVMNCKRKLAEAVVALEMARKESDD